jgi:H+/Cl- antiporter ClcA
MADETALPTDPRSLIRSRQYHVLLVLAAIVGVIVSFASWAFLEVIHYLQVGIFEDLPEELGYDSAPWWWPLPWLALAGVLTALAIERLPGRGGHVPVEGIHAGGAPTQPIDLPGVLVAALASLGLGVVLGPEAPLIALGMGLAIMSIRVVKRDAPDQVLGVLAAAGSFAAISSIFGSPVVGSIIIIEAAGLAGAILPVILLPGLLAAGIGSLVFIGMGDRTGLSTSDFALQPLSLPAFSNPDAADFAWTIPLAIAAAVVVFAIVEIAKWARQVVTMRPVLLTTVAALAIAALAIAFEQSTDETADLVLFSGQEAFGPLFDSASALSLGTLALLLVFKGLAWSLSLGNFRGGPTFPALFLGAVAGLLAADLPGLSETPAVAVLMAAACVSILMLPLSSVIIVLALTASAGLGVSPLVILGVVVAYISMLSLSAVRDARSAGDQPSETPASQRA